MDIIALSIPIFLVMIGVELVAARRLDRPVYRFNDSVNDLSCGLINQVISVFTAVGLFALYVFTYERFALFEWSAGGWTWLAAVVGVDFGYYWFHRLAHEKNLLWATHVVHHQSEDYNFTVALRQGAIEPLATWIFYQPLALLGIPPLTFLTVSALHTVFQFFVHTRLVRSLGPLELFMNTPSHHRVHHGADARYVDRNYSGMFIVWDRLFGTFQAEEAEPTYGLVKPLRSWNPLWANVQFPVELWRATAGWRLEDRLTVWWRGPTETAEALGLPRPSVAGRARYDSPPLRGLVGYTAAHFSLALLGTVALLLGGPSLSAGQLLTLGLLVVATLGCLGGLIEGRVWARLTERIRLVAYPILGLAVAGGWGLALGLLIAAASLHWLRR